MYIKREAYGTESYHQNLSENYCGVKHYVGFVDGKLAFVIGRAFNTCRAFSTNTDQKGLTKLT